MLHYLYKFCPPLSASPLSSLALLSSIACSTDPRSVICTTKCIALVARAQKCAVGALASCRPLHRGGVW